MPQPTLTYSSKRKATASPPRLVSLGARNVPYCSEKLWERMRDLLATVPALTDRLPLSRSDGFRRPLESQLHGTGMVSYGEQIVADAD